jgi:glycine/D-amino acid oxidase-like deaminating enzyme
MKTYDWIVIGGGITGSALAYELVKKKFQVLLLEKDSSPKSATLYSYGGLAYWSGTTDLTRQICAEGIELHRNLSQELEADTEFREIDLVLTIDAGNDPQTVAAQYSQFAIAQPGRSPISPNILSVEEACELEPLLNPDAIAGVLKLPHGHIHPQKTNLAYQQAFLRAGGEIVIAEVLDFIKQGETIGGVKTDKQIYHSANTVVCAGGLSRSLLARAGIKVKNYFTYAQLIKTPPVDIQLNTLVMPAVQQRFAIEATASSLELENSWDKLDSTPILTTLDAGAVQFLDGSFCIGQISQIVTDPNIKTDELTGESQIRKGVSRILPLVGIIPGNWHQCLVAFSNNSLPLVGAIENLSGIYLFSGFTSTLVFAPPLARHFANWAASGKDSIIDRLSSISCETVNT